ncbi:MAG TPA: hypothetical protein DGR97_06885 [Gammaproteobacteria bacterium]|mgnify:CR=1 FL=1|nr:hypothetical protein [Gammaproteobacteria bacterium]
MDCTKFLKTLLTSIGVLVVLVYGLILLVDPYQNVPFSLPLDRAPISTNQRFAYPALARNPIFNSVIIGSSTVRLLNPQNLDNAIGTRFANLAMNSATAYEQKRMHELFLRHHPVTDYVVIGIDDSWCRRETEYKKYTFRAFPEWMFNDNSWDDLLYMFNDKALENTVRLLEYVVGRRTAKYEINGYRNFTMDFGVYDPRVVRARLYPNGVPLVRRIPQIPPDSQYPSWEFAAHDLLSTMLATSSEVKGTIIIFAPLHGDYLARSEALYRECKGRIVMLGQEYGVKMIDFMIESEITSSDEKFWDPLHFRNEVARMVESSIVDVLAGTLGGQRQYVTY